jgi:hypothetical protein
MRLDEKARESLEAIDRLLTRLARLRDLRVKADYYEDQVHYDEASEAAAMAQRLVTSLLDGTTR